MCWQCIEQCEKVQINFFILIIILSTSIIANIYVVHNKMIIAYRLMLV